VLGGVSPPPGRAPLQRLLDCTAYRVEGRRAKMRNDLVQPAQKRRRLLYRGPGRVAPGRAPSLTLPTSPKAYQAGLSPCLGLLVWRYQKLPRTLFPDWALARPHVPENPTTTNLTIGATSRSDLLFPASIAMISFNRTTASPTRPNLLP
jgi:hypothetical protein